jgi:hypothetical protein
MGTGSLSRGLSGLDVELTTHPQSSAEVKERIELYLYSHLRAIMACSRLNFIFTVGNSQITQYSVQQNALYCIQLF